MADVSGGGFHFQRHGLPLGFLKVFGELDDAEKRLAVHAEKFVAFDDAGFFRRAFAGDFIDDDLAGLGDPDLAQGASLEPARVLGFKSGGQIQGAFRARALDGEDDFFTATEHHFFHDAVERSAEAFDFFTIDREHAVAGLHARLVRRSVGKNVADAGLRNEVAGLADFPDDARGGECEKDGKQRSGDGDDDLVHRRDGGKGFGVAAAAFDGIHRRHLWQGDESARRNPAEAVLHAADFLFPNRLPEPDLEAVDLQTTPFRGEEMPDFMDENRDVEKRQDDEDQQGPVEDIGEEFHGWIRRTQGT